MTKTSRKQVTILDWKKSIGAGVSGDNWWSVRMVMYPSRPAAAFHVGQGKISREPVQVISLPPFSTWTANTTGIWRVTCGNVYCTKRLGTYFTAETILRGF